MIFINLPVADLERSKGFYTGLGFCINSQFSDESVAAIVISKTIVVMAVTRARFVDFVTGEVGDPFAGTTVINCLSASSRDEVDSLVSRALHGGGRAWLDVIEDGPMYGHSFADPDGHVWEVLHMDLSAH
jgi:predicted lactoylglutathione lyase